VSDRNYIMLTTGMAVLMAMLNLDHLRPMTTLFVGMLIGMAVERLFNSFSKEDWIQDYEDHTI
jgi:hypothetical protein